MKFADKTKQIKTYIQWAKALAKGEDVINLTQGKPNLNPPESIISEVKKKLDEDWVSQYSPSSGLPELKKLILKDLREWGVEAEDVMVTCGGAEAGFVSIAGLVNPGDEVLLISPYYAKHQGAVLAASGKPVSVQYDITRGGFQFNLDAFQEAITPKTKLAIINSPSNPTGTVLPKNDLEDIKQVCKDKDIGIFYDEVYKTLTYDGVTHHTKPIYDPETTLISGSVSKTLSMSGWRIGYAAGSKEVLDKIKSIHSIITISPATVSQVAVIAAMKKDLEPYFSKLREIYEGRRNVVLDGADEIPELIAYKPQGAMYVMMRVKEEGVDDIELVENLAKKAKVGLVPGTDFGAPGMIRLSFACAGEEKLKEAMNRLKEYFNKK